jgi:transposase
MMAMVERLVPDGWGSCFNGCFRLLRYGPQGGGRRRYGDRQVLAAMIFVATTGCTWRQLPPGFGPSGPTAHRRLTEWGRARVWGKHHRLSWRNSAPAAPLDRSRCAIDSVNMRPAKGGI